MHGPDTATQDHRCQGDRHFFVKHHSVRQIARQRKPCKGRDHRDNARHSNQKVAVADIQEIHNDEDEQN